MFDRWWWFIDVYYIKRHPVEGIGFKFNTSSIETSWQGRLDPRNQRRKWLDKVVVEEQRRPWDLIDICARDSKSVKEWFLIVNRRQEFWNRRPSSKGSGLDRGNGKHVSLNQLPFPLTHRHTLLHLVLFLIKFLSRAALNWKTIFSGWNVTDTTTMVIRSTKLVQKLGDFINPPQFKPLLVQWPIGLES